MVRVGKGTDATIGEGAIISQYAELLRGLTCVESFLDRHIRMYHITVRLITTPVSQ